MDALPVIQNALPVIQDALPVIWDALPVIQDALSVIQDALPVIQDALPLMDALPVMDALPPPMDALPVMDALPPPTDALPLLPAAPAVAGRTGGGCEASSTTVAPAPRIVKRWRGGETRRRAGVGSSRAVRRDETQSSARSFAGPGRDTRLIGLVLRTRRIVVVYEARMCAY
jgi:hypothetical protein